jgi:DNA-binding transcriptional LysR family regulator
MRAFKDLEIFMRTADSGNLSTAARSLNLTPAAASAALKRLERELGAQLFVRSTRNLRLTQSGIFFLDQCRPALASMQQACNQLKKRQGEFSGALQLSAPSDFGRNLLLPWLEEFQNSHPQVRLHVHLSDRLANVYTDPVDAAFRYGKPRDSGMVALPVAPSNRRVLCAAPSYIEKFGAPMHPDELSQHKCLCFMIGSDVHNRWQFFRASGAVDVVHVNAINASNDGDVVRQWVLRGKGVAYRSYLDVATDLQQGRLHALCADWKTEVAPLFFTVPNRSQITPLLRALHWFVTQRIQKC